MAAVGKEHVHFLKRALVEQHVDTLAASIAALGMMFLYGCFTATGHRLLAVLNQPIQFSLIHKDIYYFVIYHLFI